MWIVSNIFTNNLLNSRGVHLCLKIGGLGLSKVFVDQRLGVLVGTNWFPKAFSNISWLIGNFHGFLITFWCSFCLLSPLTIFYAFLFLFLFHVKGTSSLQVPFHSFHIGVQHGLSVAFGSSYVCSL